MNPESSSNDRTLLDAEMDQLLEMAPEARALRLAEIAAQNPEHALHLSQWLQAIEQSEGAFENPLQERDAPEQIGPWKVLQLIGRGGMGEVFLGERADGAFVRKVAIKFLRRDRASTHKQLGRERQVLARLRHPGIAQLLDGGITEHGRPYLIIEWVDGLALDAWVQQKSPSLRTRVEVLKHATEAVAYAHANLVIHRDLKPGNVMVDQQGQPRLLDFGIARLLEETQNHTLTDDRALTPAIAAPEQFTSQAASTRTDVYALGGLLYWLISGQLPHNTKGLALADLIHRVSHTDPVAPSTLGSHSFGKADADLDAIALTALSRDPEGRYASAEAMAQDLGRWLKGEAVSARLPSRWERTQRLVKQNKLAAGLTFAVFVSLSAGIATSLWQAQRATFEAQKAVVERDLASIEAERSEGLVKSFAQAFRNTENTEKLSASEWLDRTVQIAEAPSIINQATRARLLERIAEIEVERGQTVRAVTLYERALQGYGNNLSRLERVRIQCNLALGYESLTRRPEADAAIKSAVEVAERFHGTERLQLVDCLSKQVAIALLRNSVSEADVLLAQRALSELELSTARSSQPNRKVSQLILLGRALRGVDRDAAALQKYEQALSLIQKHGTNDVAQHIELLTSMATVLRGMNRFVDAKQRFEQVLALYEQSQGGAFAETDFAINLVNHAAVLNVLELHEAAAANCRRALAIFANLKGDRPGSVANAYSHLGVALFGLGEFDSARESLARARARFSTVFGETNDITLGIDMTYARLELKAGNLDKAKQYLEPVLQQFRSRKALALLSASLTVLSRIELASNRLTEAEVAARESVQIEYQRVSGRTFNIANYETQLAQVLMRKGRLAEAQQLLTYAVPIIKRSCGPDAPMLTQVHALLNEIEKMKRVQA